MSRRIRRTPHRYWRSVHCASRRSEDLQATLQNTTGALNNPFPSQIIKCIGYINGACTLASRQKGPPFHTVQIAGARAASRNISKGSRTLQPSTARSPSLPFYLTRRSSCQPQRLSWTAYRMPPVIPLTRTLFRRVQLVYARISAARVPKKAEVRNASILRSISYVVTFQGSFWSSSSYLSRKPRTLDASSWDPAGQAYGYPSQLLDHTPSRSTNPLVDETGFDSCYFPLERGAQDAQQRHIAAGGLVTPQAE